MRRALAIAVVAGIGLRLALIVAGPPPERFEYDDIARNVLAGRGYVYDQLGTPYRSFYAGLVYMALNVGTDWLSPSSPKAMLVTQSLCAGLLGLTIFAIARRFMSGPAAVAAAALAMLHPALVYYDTRKLHPLGVDSLLMMAAVWSVLRLRDDGRGAAAAAGGGALLGLAIFQRGSMMLFAVAAALWLARAGATRAARLRIVAAYTAGAVAVVAPWAARNYAIHHMLLLESMMPQQLWKGNASYSNGSGYLADGSDVYAAAPDRLKHAVAGLDETAQYRFFRQEALDEIGGDPGRAAWLMARKFGYFWTAPPNSGQRYPASFAVVYLVYYAGMLAAAGAGLAAAARDPHLRDGVALVVAFFVCVSVVHAIMFVELRHRFAIEPLLLAFVPAGIRQIAAATRHASSWLPASVR